MNYIDENDIEYFVSPGISSDGETWMTVKRKIGAAGTHRATSKNLPIRKTKAEAQKNLDVYAKRKGYNSSDHTNNG